MNLLTKSKLSFIECQNIMYENRGTLNLYHAAVEELPDNLHVAGDLFIAGSKITKLPENLTIKGDLCMDYCSIDEIPSTISVGGSIYADNSTLKTLPKGLNVGGSLNLSCTQITELPEDLKCINGSLTIIDTAITKLPEDLVVRRSLVAQRSQLKSLPEGLKVGGTLDIRETVVDKLPDNLIVGWSLLLDANSIKMVGNSIVVGAHLDVGEDCDNLMHLSGISIGGRIISGVDDIVFRSLGIGESDEPKQVTDLNAVIGHLRPGAYVEGRYIYVDHITLLDHVETHVVDSVEYTLFVGPSGYESVISNGHEYTHCSDFWDGVCKLTRDSKTQ